MIELRHADEIQALLSRARAIRWLVPDAEVERWTEEAQSFAADRVDEHRAALAGFAEGGEPMPHGVCVVRSMYEACFAAEGPKGFGDVSAHDANAIAWMAQLERARRAMITFAARALDAARIAAVAELVWSAFRSPTDAPKVHRAGNEWTTKLLARIRAAPDALTVVPGGETWLLEALAIESMYAGARPWTPLFALWERGLATLAGVDGRVVLFVPVRRGEEILAEPTESTTLVDADKDGDRWAQTAQERLQRRYAYGVFRGGARLSVYERDPKDRPSRVLSWWAITRRFYRMGLGALPGMLTDKIDTGFDLVVSNSPTVRPSLLVTTVPAAPWTERDALAWCSATDDDRALLAASTPDESRRSR